MSTDMQRYSVENQQELISRFAKEHGIQIVRSYVDEGRSGLTFASRPGLQKLIADVTDGQADFDAILVYDVSRWGRFQDADESAYYEWMCRYAGKLVIYCAEQFNNDGSPLSNILKGMKRAMAGEYSRELSAKVWRGQAKLAKLGYHVTGPANYGFRRMMVDETGKPKGVLESGEKKAIQSYKVILIAGPDSEIEIVRHIFYLFIHERMYYEHIARKLNELEIPYPRKQKKWTKEIIKGILKNQIYVGISTYNKTSEKLKSRKIKNSKSEWVIAKPDLEPIISQQTFDAAAARMAENPRIHDQENLTWILTRIYQRYGYLSATVLKKAGNGPSPAVLRKYFGSVGKAYRAAGFNPFSDVCATEGKRRTTAKRTIRLCDSIRHDLQVIGTQVQMIGTTTLLVGSKLSVKLVIATACKSNPRPRAAVDEYADLFVVLDQLGSKEIEWYVVDRVNLKHSTFYIDKKNVSFDPATCRVERQYLPQLLTDISRTRRPEPESNGEEAAFEKISSLVHSRPSSSCVAIAPSSARYPFPLQRC